MKAPKKHISISSFSIKNTNMKDPWDGLGGAVANSDILTIQKIKEPH